MAIIQKRYAHLNQSDSGSLHRKLDATSAYITGSVEAASTLTVRGASQFDDVAKFGNTAAAEAIIAGNGGVPNLDLVVSGTVVIGDMLNVFGDITGGNDLDIANLANIGGNLQVTGEITGSAAALLQSTLKVDGQADMVDVLPQLDLTYDLGSAAKRWAELHAGTAVFTNLEADYLDVAITASVAQLTASVGAEIQGPLSASSLVVANLADLNGQLDVALAAEFHSTLSASGNAQFGGTLTLAGNADLNGQLDVALAAEFHSTLSASGNAQLGGTITVAGNADFNGQLDVADNFSVATNKFSVIAASGDTSVAGDLTVSGDLVVMGDRIEAQVTQLVVEDGLVTLMSGATNRSMSNEAGIEVEVGGQGQMPAIKFANTLGGASGSWVSNLDWIPSEDLKYDLGIPSNRWRELNISGDANIGGALDAGAVSAASLAVAGAATFGAGIAVTGTGSFTQGVSAQTLSASAAISGGSFSTDGSLTVQGTADLNGGLDVVGAISASQGVTAASFDADGQGNFGTLLVDGYAAISGGLGVVGAVSASAALQGASVAVDGLGEFGSLDVSGNAQFTSLTASVGAEIQGPLSASSLVVAGNADFNGTATFNGTFAVPGTGSFGALVVGGINMSPISSSSPVSTVDAGTATLLTQALVADDMAKFEIEVVARGRGTEMGDNGNNAAAWKISVAAMHDGANIQAAATELSKEFFGPLGANLDVDIETSGNNIIVKAKGTASASTVFWDAQIVKKMVMNSANGARKY